jgi:hypothetical protein
VDIAKQGSGAQVKKDTKAGIRELEKRLDNGEPMSDEERVEALRVLGLGGAKLKGSQQLIPGMPNPPPQPEKTKQPEKKAMVIATVPAQPTRRQKKIIDTGLACLEPAQDEDIGYMARMLVMATMPHSKHEGNEFTRVNGSFRLSILAPSDIGLPYGSIPRLILAWITTEACRTKSRVLKLGRSMSEFMAELGEVPTGGRWGSVARVKHQTKRLVSSTIFCTYEGNRGLALQVVDAYEFWWDKEHPGQTAMWASHIHLGERFFNEIIDRPIPMDMRALRVLKKSPMALDIYCWLTHRMSYLQSRTLVPWASLAGQFGADYSRTRDFKAYFIRQLKAVAAVYPDARVALDGRGLELLPSESHVSKRIASPVHKPGI